MFNVNSLYVVCFLILSLISPTLAKEYSFKFSERSINLIQNETVFVDIFIDPENIEESDSFRVNLTCSNPQDGSIQSGCSVIKVVDNQEFWFQQGETYTKLEIRGIRVGKEQLVIKAKSDNPTHQVKLDHAFVVFNVGKSQFLVYLDLTFGWVYFIAWSISFYPQIYDNWRLQSVEGMNMDYAVLITLGFFVHLLFNVGLYFFPFIQQQFEDENPRNVVPVEFNDVMFTVHGFAGCIFTLFQCTLYKGGDQKLSPCAKFILWCTFLFYPVFGFLIYSDPSLTVLDLLYYSSCLKIFITVVTYAPQAIHNYRRQSTVGWPIWGVVCDTLGSVLSFGQMVVLSLNYNDWNSFLNNLSKSGLAVVTLLFDILFFWQHFVLYHNAQPISTNSDTIKNADSTWNELENDSEDDDDDEESYYHE